MKTIPILLILLSACSTLCAQEARKPDRIDTLTVNGNTYYYYPDPVSEIYSSKNKIKIDKVCDGFHVDHETSGDIKNVVKKVFNSQRMHELAENKYNIHFKMYCNINGEILETTYLLYNKLKVSQEGDKYSLSVKEIDLLNEEVKKHKFNLTHTCPDVKYYVVWWGFISSKYVNE